MVCRVVAAASLLLSTSFFLPGCEKKEEVQSEPPPQVRSSPVSSDFETANLRILAYDRETEETAFGNTETAVDLAVQFNEILTLMERIAFTGGAKNRRLSLTDEKFLTHCELRERKALFLVHVPQLKNYEGEVREVLLEIAWTAASEVSSEICPDCEIGVGLRGSLVYGAVAIGHRDAKPAVELGAVVDDERLRAFFVGPPFADTHLSPEELQNRAEVSAVLEGVRSPDRAVRLEAILKLEALEGSTPAAVEELMKVISHDPEPQVRAAAVRTLAKKEGARSVPTLRKVLSEIPWQEVADAAADGLLQSGPAGLQVLHEVYETHPHRRMFIIGGFERLGPEAAPHRALLLSAVSDPNPRTAAAAVRALGALSDPDLIPTMIDCLAHQDYYVREAAVSSLRSLGAEGEGATRELARAYARSNLFEERRAIATILAGFGPSIREELKAMRDRGELDLEAYNGLLLSIRPRE